jgi:hypothetical protein
MHVCTFFLLSLAPQPSLGLGLLHKIRQNFLVASQQFSFLQGRVVSPTPNPITGDQASVFISSRGRVVTHFSRLLRHAWVTVELFLFPGLHRGNICVSNKVKIKLSLCVFDWAPHHEGVLGSGGIASRILDLGTGWRWAVIFMPRPLCPQERAACTHWIGGWVGPRAGLDAVVKRKIRSPCRDSNSLIIQPIDSDIPLSCPALLTCFKYRLVDMKQSSWFIILQKYILCLTFSDSVGNNALRKSNTGLNVSNKLLVYRILVTSCKETCKL